MSLTPEQLAQRRFGLGGSDIGAVLGFCQYRSQLDVYLEKTEGKTQEESYRMWWGTGQEPFVLDTLQFRPHFFTPETTAPSTLVRGKTLGTLVHPDEHWMLATPDAIAWLPGRVPVLVEVKTASVKKAEGWGDAGSSDVPTKYAAQALWTMGVIRHHGYPCQEAWVLALFGNREPQRFVIPWDEGRAEWLLEEGRKFWFNHVAVKVPPNVSEAA